MSRVEFEYARIAEISWGHMAASPNAEVIYSTEMLRLYF